MGRHAFQGRGRGKDGNRLRAARDGQADFRGRSLIFCANGARWVGNFSINLQSDMRVLIVNTSERTGGAAIAASRLKDALIDNGVKAKMLVRTKESDNVSPKTAYGRTKWAGEQVLAKTNAIIFRTAWLYSTFGNNFVKTMLRLGKEKSEIGVVFDQIGTPTYAKHLAQAIFQAIESKDWHAGTYHFTNEGVCSWYDFTHEIFRQYNALCPHNPIGAKVKPIHSSEYQYRTPRPYYSVLDKQKYKETFGATIPHWTEGLHECLEKLVEN